MQMRQNKGFVYLPFWRLAEYLGWNRLLIDISHENLSLIFVLEFVFSSQILLHKEVYRIYIN